MRVMRDPSYLCTRRAGPGVNIREMSFNLGFKRVIELVAVAAEELDAVVAERIV